MLLWNKSTFQQIAQNVTLPCFKPRRLSYYAYKSIDLSVGPFQKKLVKIRLGMVKLVVYISPNYEGRVYDKQDRRKVIQTF